MSKKLGTKVWIVASIFAMVAVVVGALVAKEMIGGLASVVARKVEPRNDRIARGAYLAQIGNCAGCHTAPGGEPFAGGKGIATPFGTIYAGNLTPDAATGIGAWSADEFYRALREGRSRDGHLLYPAFPYPNISLTTRDDSDALYAFLMHRVAPVARANTAHTLRFPFNHQAALAMWRVLYFSPATYEPDTTKGDAWNRGAYLVQGLAHCGACHSTRNALGAPIAGHAYDGAMMPLNDWYAPSLTARDEASVADWDLTQIAAWLRHGISERGTALGPMAEVVFQSTQHLLEEDALAMATYLKALTTTPAPLRRTATATGKRDAQGEKLYVDHCSACHGDNGQGKVGAFPALAGNRAVTMANTTNLIHVVLAGGFAPATAGNPRPHGMPPYYHVLSDAEIAKLLTYIRTAWGNDAAAVTDLDLVRYRNALRTQ